ncbi:MAG TPA: hypothetical protein GX717_09305, partial [Clostridiaceae bacterium]|nr:hypothetical protein [Clostridiaceae bacterium]
MNKKSISMVRRLLAMLLVGLMVFTAMEPMLVGTAHALPAAQATTATAFDSALSETNSPGTSAVSSISETTLLGEAAVNNLSELEGDLPAESGSENPIDPVDEDENSEEPVEEEPPVNEFTIKVVKSGPGSVRLNGEEYETLTVPTGSEVTLVVSPEEDDQTHHYLQELKINNDVVTSAKRDEPTQLTIVVEKDYVVEAAFSSENKITVESGAEGSVLLNNVPANSLTVPAGDSVDLQIEPAENYVIHSIQIGDQQPVIENEHLFQTTLTPSQHTLIRVQYLRVYTVTINQQGESNWGSIESTPEMLEGVVTVKQGNHAVIQATPNSGYRVAKVEHQINADQPRIEEFKLNDKSYSKKLEKN